MKRTVSFCTALLLLASSLALAACGGTENENTPVNTEDSVSAVSQTEAVTEEVPPLTFVDMKGEDFTVMTKYQNTTSKTTWTDEVFTIDEADADVVNDAVFRHKQTLEEKFNCNIVDSQLEFGNIFTYTLHKELSKLVQAGDDLYDFVMPTIQDCAKLACDGMLWDLTYYKTIDLTAPWWDQTFLAETGIGDRVYYADGDICLTFMRAAYAIFFSKQAITDYDLDDPYQIVSENKWTIDRLMEMSHTASEDINGNGSMDSEDKIGLLMLYNSGEAFYAASGVRLVTADENGNLTFTGDSEKSIGIMNKIYDIYMTTTAVLNCDEKARMLSSNLADLGNVDRGAAIFSSGSALFLFGTMNNVPLMRDMKTDFGILPLPMADDSQNGYYSYVHTWASGAAAIPISAKNPENTAAFMEAAAYYGSKIMTPAYYEKALKTKYARDEESGAMLDIIYKNRRCDLGNIYNVGTVLSGMTSLITQQKKNTFVSMIETRRSKIDTELAEINDAFFNQLDIQ